MRLDIDHLIICVPDLDLATERFMRLYGLATAEGGRHVGHGTANRIVPLGRSYIELLTVVDEVEAGSSPFGSWVQDHQSATRMSVDGVCLRTNDLEVISARLDLQPVEMVRKRPDGYELKWTLAGLDFALGPDRLPFFIQWQVPSAELPGRMKAEHKRSPGGVTALTLSGDVERLERWTRGSHEIRVTEGPAGVVGADILVGGDVVRLSGAVS